MTKPPAQDIRAPRVSRGFSVLCVMLLFTLQKVLPSLLPAGGSPPGLLDAE